MPAIRNHSSLGSRLPEAERGGDFVEPGRCPAGQVGQAPRDTKRNGVADIGGNQPFQD
jgi:hypothetical protein